MWGLLALLVMGLTVLYLVKRSQCKLCGQKMILVNFIGNLVYECQLCGYIKLLRKNYGHRLYDGIPLRALLPANVVATLEKTPEQKDGGHSLIIVTNDGNLIGSCKVRNKRVIELPSEVPYLIGADGYLFMYNIKELLVEG